MAAPADTRRSSSRLATHLGVSMRAVLTGLCLAQAWMVVFVLRIGPVVAVLDAQAGRGVHSGDFLAFPLVGVAMLLLSEELAARSPHGPKTATAR